ncbi:hypothetical protein G3545_27190 [Starkeya sp. ORNL1]|uniref:hypothetical protein n=1 Tax=Starkeya sp. ORNL1 TaxID=2709380 RepID=UPI0014638E61|nr:hypothetical protein [Starkeya sp. ORNL1]QJP17008.1 hypothetical protein G3545_27190 [Starkeya sp. ORNL1]
MSLRSPFRSDETIRTIKKFSGFNRLGHFFERKSHSTFAEDALEHFPIRWNHLIEEELLQSIESRALICRSNRSIRTERALVLHPRGEPDRAQHHDDRKHTEHERFHYRFPYPWMLSDTQEDTGYVIKTAEHSYQI